MTLGNLVKTGQLKEHKAAPDEVKRLLDAAARNLKDSEVAQISVENRFDAAYKATMQAALVALMANGYAPDTKSPGHHQTTIQSLAKTIGLSGERVAVLEALPIPVHGSARLTQDVDVVYARDADNLSRIARALAPLGPYLRGAPTPAAHDRGGAHRRALPLHRSSDAKAAAGRPKDLEIIAELRALLEERDRA